MKTAAKVLLGGIAGGAIGFGVGYIWKRLKERKPEGEVVYEPDIPEKDVEPEPAMIPVQNADAAELLKKAEEKMQYIPASGWHAVAKEMFDLADGLDEVTYLYFKDDEVLAGPRPSMEEVDVPDVFDAAYSAAEAGQREFWMANTDIGEKVHVWITDEDYAEKFQEWSDMQFDAAEVLYPEEE